MIRTPKLSDAQLNRLDAVGAHFKFKDMFSRLNQVVSSSAQLKRSQTLLLYQQVFSQNMPDERDSQNRGSREQRQPVHHNKQQQRQQSRGSAVGVNALIRQSQKGSINAGGAHERIPKPEVRSLQSDAVRNGREARHNSQVTQRGDSPSSPLKVTAPLRNHKDDRQSPGRGRLVQKGEHYNKDLQFELKQSPITEIGAAGRLNPAKVDYGNQSQPLLGSGGLDDSADERTLEAERKSQLTVTAGEGSVNVQNKNYNVKKVKISNQDQADQNNQHPAKLHAMEAAAQGLELVQQRWPNIQAGLVNINIVQNNNNSTGGSSASQKQQAHLTQSQPSSHDQQNSLNRASYQKNMTQLTRPQADQTHIAAQGKQGHVVAGSTLSKQRIGGQNNQEQMSDYIDISAPQAKLTDRKYAQQSAAKPQPFMRRNIMNQTMGQHNGFLHQSQEHARSSNRSSLNRENSRGVASRERMSSLIQLDGEPSPGVFQNNNNLSSSRKRREGGAGEQHTQFMTTFFPSVTQGQAGAANLNLRKVNGSQFANKQGQEGDAQNFQLLRQQAQAQIRHIQQTQQQQQQQQQSPGAPSLQKVLADKMNPMQLNHGMKPTNQMGQRLRDTALISNTVPQPNRNAMNAQTAQQQQRFSTMSRNRNNKTTLEQPNQPSNVIGGWQQPIVSHLAASSMQEQVALKRRLSANPNNEQWATRDAKANSSLPMTIQGVSQPKGGGTHRLNANNAQYSMPRTRSIVVEKGRSAMEGNNMRQASESPKQQLISMAGGSTTGKKPMILEPMANTSNSITNTHQNLSASIQDMSMMSQQNNSRTQEAKKFATYNNTNGKLQKAGSTQNNDALVGKISRQVILNNKVTEDDLNGSSGGNIPQRKTRPKF